MPNRRETGMNSKSELGPAGENSRRGFMQKLGTLAAASSVAASASAQSLPLPARSGGRGGPTRPEPGPLAKQPMPTVRFGKHEIGRLIMGVNGPGAHFSVKEGADARAWLTPERILEENRHMEELGINCMEAGARRFGPVRHGKRRQGAVWAAGARRGPARTNR